MTTQAASGGVERELAAGEVLVREGEPGSEAYRVIAGRLEILCGPEETLVDVVGPGATVGEIAILVSGVRTATVRATEPSVVQPLDRAGYRRWLGEDGARAAELTAQARERIDHRRLVQLLAELFSVDVAAAQAASASFDWRHLAAGDELFRQGKQSDAAYLVVRGRLRVDRDGATVGEIGRGELVGEDGLLEDAPRTATVTAKRDTTLARIGAEAFTQLTAAHPTLMLQVVRTVLARRARPDATHGRARTIAIVVVAPIDRRAFTTRVANELARHGPTRHLWGARVDSALDWPGATESDSPLVVPAMAELLQEAETANDFLLLELDGGQRWADAALRLADRVVVVTSARPEPQELARVEALVTAAPAGDRVERWLAVLHPADASRPSGSGQLADRFDVDRVANLRLGDVAGVGRLARLVAGAGTGLVLGGGGARGFAHIGVWQALAELDVRIDAIAGASIGAPLGVMMAMQLPAERLRTMTAELFHGLLDYTVPVVSLIKGERIARNIEHALGDLDLRDTWLPFACVSTNLTRACVEVHDRGPATSAVRASVAIPGVLPPVPAGGDLLVDGGVLNNLPCDVLRASGMVERLIAVDLSPAAGPRAHDDYGLSVSGWKALRARIGSGPSPYPGIAAIIMRSLTAASMRDRDRLVADGGVDCYLDLDLRGVQLLEFERVAEIAERGYETALPRLRAWLAGGSPDVAADPA